MEARIKQLQSDFVLDVHHAKVDFVKAPSSGRGVSSVPKSGKTVAKGVSRSQTSRLMEKLTQEKTTKLKRQQHLQRKTQNVKEKTTSKSSISSMILPGTARKTILPTAKMTASLNKKSKGCIELSEEIGAPVSTPFSAAAPLSQRLSGESQTQTDAEGRPNELAEVEKLERRLSLQASLWTTSSTPEWPPKENTRTECGDMQQSIRSYLEACVFVGDTERAHSFLLSQHRVRSRRRQLNTDVYNIMMRVWAKKVSSHTVFIFVP